MKTEYRDYMIEVIARQKDVLWAADVWIWTPEQTRNPSNYSWGQDEYRSADDAVAAGVALAEAEIDMRLAHIR